MISVVHGLLRQGKLYFLTALREKLQSFLKEKVKEIASSYLKVPCLEEDTEDAPSLPDLMRGLEFEPWVSMMGHIFDSVLIYLKAVQVSLVVNIGVFLCGKSKSPSLPLPLSLSLSLSLSLPFFTGLSQSDSWCM